MIQNKTQVETVNFQLFFWGGGGGVRLVFIRFKIGISALLLILLRFNDLENLPSSIPFSTIILNNFICSEFYINAHLPKLKPALFIAYNVV